METQSIVQQPIALQAVTEVAGESFSRRFWAYLIDLVVLYIANGICALVAGIIAAILLLIFAGGVAQTPHVLPGWWDWLTGIILSSMFFGACEWLYGATFGKIILKMRVIRTNGEPCGLIAALVRGILRLVDGLFFGAIAYFSMQFPLYQRVGDKAANTVVVRANSPVIRHRRSAWGFVAATALYVFFSLIIYTFYAVAMYNPN